MKTKIAIGTRHLSKNYTISKATLTKNGHRLHFYISEDLFAEIDNWVSMSHTSIAKFCRQSIQYYLKNKRREVIESKLSETCQNLKKINNACLKGWLSTTNVMTENESD